MPTILLLLKPRSYERAVQRLLSANYQVASLVDSFETLQDLLQTRRSFDVAVLDEKLFYIHEALPLIQRLHIPVLTFRNDYQDLMNDLQHFFGISVEKEHQHEIQPIAPLASSSPMMDHVAIVPNAPDVILESTDLSHASATIEDVESQHSDAVQLSSEPEDKAMSETNPFLRSRKRDTLITSNMPTTTPTPAVVERIVEVQVPVEKIIERETIVEKVIHVPVTTEKVIEIQTGVAQKVIIVASLFPRVGGTTLATLIAQSLAHAHVRVAVIEAPGITPSLLELANLHDQSQPLVDYRMQKNAPAIQKDGIAWYPLITSVDQSVQDQIDMLLRLLYRLREFPLVILDAGSEFYDEEVFDVADETWLVLVPDPVRLARGHNQPMTPEYNRYQTIMGPSNKGARIIINQSSTPMKNTQDLYPGAVHIPFFPYDDLQRCLWNLAWPTKDKILAPIIQRALLPLIKPWLQNSKNNAKKSLFPFWR